MNRSIVVLVSSVLMTVGACAKPAGQATDVATAGSAAVKPAFDVDAYRPAAERIMQSALAENDAWAKMEQLCDGIGHRLSGSPGLERAVAWAVEAMRADGQEHVRAEPVMVPKWVRGHEWARTLKPMEYDMHMLGLGMSVGTSAEGVTAPVVVVKDKNELEAIGDDVRGKIVLFNHAMPPYDPELGSQYGTAVEYRGAGPSLAAEKGAVACLVRSVTATSLRSPHTGATRYLDGIPEIPAAAISIEDAEMIRRLTARGEEVVINLKMDARHEGQVQSANVVGELRGRSLPDEVLVIGGHLDAWDVGQGAHDDAGGCVIAMEAINVLRKLGMIPRRTIRVVLWTNEENGLAGGKQYAIDHAEELAKHAGAIESDSGIFAPQGLGVRCGDPEKQARAEAQLRVVLRLLEPLGATTVEPGWGGADIGPMEGAGVVLMGFQVEGSIYFDYHHSHADTLDKVDPKHLSECVAALAVMSYVIADMPDRLGEKWD